MKEIEIVCDQETMKILAETKPPEGIKISTKVYLKKSIGNGPQLLSIIYTLGSNVVAGILASFIYNKLTSKKPEYIRINNIEIEFNEGEISRIISNELEINSG